LLELATQGKKASLVEDLLLDVRAGLPRVGPEEWADSERRGAGFP